MKKTKIEMLEPEHRCKKCKTPLNFNHNYIRSEEETKEFLKRKSLWWVISNPFKAEIDRNRQHWSCPKCHEDYLITKGDKK